MPPLACESLGRQQTGTVAPGKSGSGFFVDRLEAALGATLLVSCLIYGKSFPIYNLLDHCLARFYRHISYSSYLLHFIVFYIAACFFLKQFPAGTAPPLLFTWSLILLSILAITPVAWAFYKFIELPLIALSKKLGNRLQPFKR